MSDLQEHLKLTNDRKTCDRLFEWAFIFSLENVCVSVYKGNYLVIRQSECSGE